VTSGQLKLYKISSEGKEQTLSLLRSGNSFGICTAFATESFPANAMAIEESAVLIIPGELMEIVAKKEPALLLNIIQILSQRLKESMTFIESPALKEVPERRLQKRCLFSCGSFQITRAVKAGRNFLCLANFDQFNAVTFHVRFKVDGKRP